jgi:hypothetical protein
MPIPPEPSTSLRHSAPVIPPRFWRGRSLDASREPVSMSRRLIPILWIALGIGLILVIVALSRSTTTAPVSHRVPGEGRMQPFYGVEPTNKR